MSALLDLLSSSRPHTCRGYRRKPYSRRGRFWLHLGEGWRFFAPENLITRLKAVLEAEPQVFQVGINFGDAAKLTGATAAEQTVRRAPDGGRYVLTGTVASGPAMFDTERLDRIGGADDTNIDSIADLGP